jgi:adenosylcobyric acid synthase
VKGLADEAFAIVDCLTLWASNALEAGGDDVEDEAERIAALLADRPRSGVVISNEVGLGIVPMNALARRYRDVLGVVNRSFARRAERAYLVVAGKGLPLVDVAAP